LESELMGIDNKIDLSKAEKQMQEKLRHKALEKGVTLIDSETVWFSNDTEIGMDVIIEPNVFFGKGVVIGNNCLVRSFTYIENAKIGDDVILGPFARIRPGTNIESGAQIKESSF